MAILDFVQTYLRCDFLDMAMPIITWLGNGGILWIVCSLLLTAYPRIRKAGIAMAVSLVLKVLCCNVVLKPFVARVRPCDVNTTVRLLIPHPEGFSFPSGHTGALLGIMLGWLGNVLVKMVGEKWRILCLKME